MNEKKYSIGEVSKLLNVKEHTLRFWEKEFPFLKPAKTQSGRRVYCYPDIKILQKLKKLLYQDGYTTKGAFKILENSFDEKDELTDEKNFDYSNQTNDLKKRNKASLFKEDVPSTELFKKVNKEILLRVYNGVDDLIRLWEDFLDDE